METTIRINTNLLNADIIDGIKKLFPNQEVDIIIQNTNDNDLILNNPAYAEELRSRIKEYETKQQGITLKTDDLL